MHLLWKVFSLTENGEFETTTLRNFRNHFQLSRQDPVFDLKTLLLWAKNVRATGSALKRKTAGRPRSVRNPEITKLLLLLLLFEGNPLQVRHKQDWGRGFILLLPQTGALPGSDAGSDVIKPASSFVIQNRQTSCSIWCPMYRARC